MAGLILLKHPHFTDVIHLGAHKIKNAGLARFSHRENKK
jgi:hypothetical protein